MHQPTLTAQEVAEFRSGIYLHYKGGLYEAMHLTHNASEGNRIEVLYFALELDPQHAGPRHATREFREFLQDRVHEDGSLCDHNPVTKPGHTEFCSSVLRFRYLGPVFEPRMLDIAVLRREDYLA